MSEVESIEDGEIDDMEEGTTPHLTISKNTNVRPNLYRNTPQKMLSEERKGDMSMFSDATTNHRDVTRNFQSPMFQKQKDEDEPLIDMAKHSSRMRVNGQKIDPRGEAESIKEATQLLAENNPAGGVNCSYYDYTYHTEHKNIILKLSRN